ncbi:hypothetical protein RclHR1_09180003 [Rhizophagus clarus]|uniref:Crinkler effector protein N-terminal domain-containing protein n=1 Tax=Rhizophagus clarus TaxID=94130 RepID=A0A2Z6SQ27_9GLOM|nr:hypothetical protein RclHR1_09180003 [Rhizophagus clarus]
MGNILHEIFKIEIKKEETVKGLKEIIMEKQNFDDLSFKLWKVDIPFRKYNEKLIKLVTDYINIKEDLKGLEMKDTNDINIFQFFLNNDEECIHILIESRISFKICAEKMELLHNNIIINSNSMTEFIQQTKSEQHKNSSKENLKIYIHKSKITLDWTSFLFRVLRERKTNRGLRKLCKDLDDIREAKTVPEVGDRKVQHIPDSGMDAASVFFAEEYAKVIPIIFAFLGMVDGEAYIVAVLNPEKKSDVYVRKVPVKFKSFPVMIGYRAFEPLSLGIGIGDPVISSTATLGAFFEAKTAIKP